MYVQYSVTLIVVGTALMVGSVLVAPHQPAFFLIPDNPDALDAFRSREFWTVVTAGVGGLAAGIGVGIGARKKRSAAEFSTEEIAQQHIAVLNSIPGKSSPLPRIW